MTPRNIIFGTVIGLSALAATAQTLEKEIIITRDIEPVERAASRLSTVSPAIYRPDIKPYHLNAALPTMGYTPYRGIATLEPVAWGDTFAISPYRGYLKLGYLPSFNLGASAGYRLVNKAATQVGAWLQYDGESHHSRINPEAEKTTLKSNVFAIGIDANHSMRHLLLNGDLRARFGNATSPLAGEDPTFGQSFAQFYVNVGALGKSKRLPWHAEIAFEHFAFKNEVECGNMIFAPAKQNVLTIGAGIARAWLAASVGVDVAFDFQSNNKAYNADGDRNLALFDVNPYLAFVKDKFNTRIGANITMGDGFYFAPNVRIAYAPTQQFAVEADLTGGKTLTNLSTLHDADIRMAGVAPFEASRVPLDGMLRLVAGPVKGLVIDVHAGWAKANSQALFAIVNGYSRWLGSDVSAFTGGLKASWAYNDKFKIFAGFDAAQHSKPSRLYYKWRDGAAVVANAGFEVHPIERLHAGLDWQLRTSRRYFSLNSLTGDCLTESLGQVNDLRLHANYSLTERFDIGLHLNNLLCRRWLTAPGAYSPRLNGLITVSYKL